MQSYALSRRHCRFAQPSSDIAAPSPSVLFSLPLDRQGESPPDHIRCAMLRAQQLEESRALLTMQTMHCSSVSNCGAQVTGRLGRTAKPSLFSAARIQRNVVVAAQGKQSWKLDKPDRLWELGETWYPGADPPEYLDATLPGDRGFDPARLFQNPSTRAWLVEGELYNGRVAMIAAVGIMFQEAVGKGPWWSAPFRANWPLPYVAGVIVSHAIYATFELKRFQNFQKYGETGLLNSVPFDPLGLRRDRTRQNEVRNGRLAMLANLGFWSQAATTGKGPWENVQDHMNDPTHVNIFTNPRVGFEATVAAVFIGIVPIVLEARKDLTPEDKRKEEAVFRPFPFL